MIPPESLLFGGLGRKPLMGNRGAWYGILSRNFNLNFPGEFKRLALFFKLIEREKNEFNIHHCNRYVILIIERGEN